MVFELEFGVVVSLLRTQLRTKLGQSGPEKWLKKKKKVSRCGPVCKVILFLSHILLVYLIIFNTFSDVQGPDYYL